METQEIAAAARHFAAMARIVGPDPKAMKMRRHAFHLHQSGSTTLSASALLLPRGALAEPPPLLDRICAAHGHAGDVALTAASLVEPFLVAEQRGNPGDEFQPRLVPEARLDVLVEHEELGNTPDGNSGPPRWLSARLLAMVIGDQTARRINVSVMQHRGDPLLLVGSPFGLLSPFHFFNSISVGAVANCLPPCSVRHSLLMADIHCLPGMEGAPVFDKNSGLVGLLMNPLRQNGSSIEVQLVITWEAICTGWNNKEREEIGRDPRLCSSLSCGVVSKVVQVPSTQLSHPSSTVDADDMDIPVMLQTTAAVHPGASGGILVNPHGLMVGIVTRYNIRFLKHSFRNMHFSKSFFPPPLIFFVPISSNAKHGGGSTIPHLNFSIPCKSLETIFKYSEIGEPAILEQLDKPNEVLSSVWALAPSSSPFIDNPPEKAKEEKVLEFSKFLSDKQATLKSSTDLKELFKNKIPSKI
nr:unnamed protein product [Digitaria exilis]